MKDKLKILVSGGGTGGHIFPAVAIADEIRKRFSGAEFLFIGANGKMEMEKIPQAGYSIKGIDIVGIKRKKVLSNFALPFILIKSLFATRKIIKDWQPDFAIGTGGFASGPSLFVAQTFGIPVYIQEQNAHAGITNKILSKKAKRIFTAYPEVEGFPKEKISFLGNPVREAIVNNEVTQVRAKELLGLSPEKTIVLSIGGSLGSKTINDAWLDALPHLESKNIQVLWQTGSTEYQKIAEHKDIKNNENLKVQEFIKNMELAYAAADIIVSRAGAISISELAISQKPIILVPYPFAAEDHQTKNALNLVHKKAAVMVKDSEMKTLFWDTLTKLLENENARSTMAQNLAYFSKPNATKDIVDEIIKMETNA